MTDEPVRASDEERDAVLGALADALAAGRISSEELEQRSALALQARTRGDLAELMTDLPSQPRGSRLTHLVDQLLVEAQQQRISRADLTMLLLSRS